MSSQIKIALIDDEQLILEGVKMLLSNEKNISVCVTADNGPDFIEQLEKISENDFPDIALVDVQMKPMNGFELVEILKEKYPDLKIIILSSHYKTSILGYMVKLGVSAFLPKNSNKKIFIEAITMVNKNGVFFTAEDHQMLFTYMNSSAKKNSLFETEDELSEREKDVVKLICQEFTNNEIGEKLFISPRTVESHRQRILEKIGAKNTVGIVIYAIINNIYSLEKL
ncbi:MULTISPECIES: response regulator [Chryseobacterium]|jgi:Response regulator containing a CheY-like receiver domain and an HTH DNA-binding domain|uniref:DNA-binding NarL/FixJ family response regulator n=1 Tax=Chryseobacterium rhizosphaerae TaxID=395937 RepID=A0AAE4C5C1_9FLAO|nr:MULTISPECIES: response regulator transcription factor [Chryseobacterium]MBL3548166.1 response regulator transcription factor [Chryseobacterium sp. KMC2]MDC8098793.1 response regulator transcription factor [Chryseobacterium rhizosphaerae]MDR6527540.1 DNA-binding NarL/FixJ family response regulator [Chryseobacterium rhizosphaerae]MDR6548790.1 DNA-binding NarL/FixJ family response regulator [Chryseobacterium rhizosphaerae]REC76657.1 DNA-binding response regulator [Chryseobacterium rhizosphaera